MEIVTKRIVDVLAMERYIGIPNLRNAIYEEFGEDFEGQRYVDDYIMSPYNKEFNQLSDSLQLAYLALINDFHFVIGEVFLWLM